MLNFYLSERTFRTRHRDAQPYFYSTRYGVGARQAVVPEANNHRDDFLALAGELSMPANTTFEWGGKEFTLNELFGYSFRWFHPDQELEFTAVAYGLYLPAGQSWKNRFHETYDLNIIADRLACKNPGPLQSCYGTHVPYALAVILCADRTEALLSEPVRHRVRNKLQLFAESLAKTQRAAGCWDKTWLDGVRFDLKEDQVVEWVRCTGHHLEWLALVEPELRPSDDHIRKAVEFLLQAFSRQNMANLSLSSF